MDPLEDIPSASTPTLTTKDPLADIPKADTAMPEAYREASQANPDHVSQAMEISQRRQIDPNYALANLDAVKKQDAMPDFDRMKSRNPDLYKLLDSNPAVLGIAHDDLHSFIKLEDHAKTAKIASSMMDAVRAGFQGSVRGLELRHQVPDVILGENAPASYDLLSQGVGMALDMPEYIAGGAAGALVGPTTATMAAFGVESGLKQALTEEFTHGRVQSASELIRRAKAVAWPTAKGAATGLALSVTGGAAAAYGASPATKMAFEVASMTATGAATEGKYPTARDFISNAFSFLGAHAASMFWDRMGDTAQESKTRGRGPLGAQAFEQHADNVSGPAYIPADKFDAHFGPDAEDMAKKLGIEQAYTAAKASGSDIEIPAGKYLSADMDKHREAFKDDVKSDPEAQTINQLKEAEEARKEEATAKAEAEKNPPKPEPAADPTPMGVPAPDPAAVNVRVIHHGETAIDSNGEPTPEESARGVLAAQQTHGPKFNDLPLTDKGREQVAKVAEDLKDHNITRTFSSTSTRTKETASAISEPTPDPRFSGIKFETDYSGMPVKEFKPILEKQLAAWAENPDAKGDNGESFNEFQARNLAALKDATQNAKPGQSIGIALSSDSAQLFKLIAENGGMPISGDMIKRMAEKEAIKPANVDAYKIAPNGLLTTADAPTVDPETPTLPYKPYAGLSVGQRAAEYHLAQILSKPEAVEAYAKLPGTMGGKLLDVDEVRQLSPEYNRDKYSRMAYTLSTHEPASAWVKQRYAEMLSEPAEGPVLFLSGGGGSGKSTVRKNFLSEVADSSDIIMDSTFSAEAKARAQIEQALASGREVSIAYIHRDFESAVKGVVHRTEREDVGGRWVPSEALAQAHVGAQETFKGIAETYRGDPRVTLHLFDNPESAPGERAQPKPMTLEQLHERSYTKEGEHPNDAIERLTESARRINGETERQAHEVGGHDTREAGGAGGNAAEASGAGRGAGGIYGEGFQSASGQRADAVAFPTPQQAREQATAQAVSDAQQETGQTPQPIPGVDPRSQDELSRAQEAASKEAEKILLKPQLEEIKRSNRAILDAERERATAEAKNVVGNEPVHRAYALFKPEGAESGPSQQSIWKKSVDYINNRLSEEDTMHFEAISEMSGFSSADEMARKLLLTERGPSFNMAVKARVDQHMEQFGNLKDTAAMREEALRAVHTDQSGQLIALRSQVLEGMAQNAEINAETAKARRAYASQMWETAKQIARDTINGKLVETAGRFRAYYTAERNAAVKAQQLEAEGKYQEAGAARLEQLHSHALAAEALRVRDSMDSWQASIKKQQAAEPASWKSQDHFFQAASIMKRFGFDRPDYDPSKRVENLQTWVARMDAESSGMVSIPAWLQDESVTKDWRKLTPPQLQDVRNALKNIKHVANAEDNMFVMGRGMEKEALVAELHEAKVANVVGSKTPGAGTYVNNWQKLTHAKDALLNNIISPETFMSELDGFKLNGPWQDTLIATKDKAMDARGEMNAEDAERLRDIHSAYSAKELKEMRSKPIYIPELDPNGAFTKDNLITLAANQGTEGNQIKVRESRGWTQDQVDSVLAKHLDERDWNLVQAKLDWMEDRKPAMADLHRRVTGFEPTWVEAKPIPTPFGEKRGGYYPLISDPRVVSRGFENMKADAMLNDPPVTFKAATAQGFLKERNDNARYAVSLDGDGFTRHMSDVTHDLTMREWVIDASRILGDKGVASDIQDSFGMENYQGMKQWLKQIAGNDVKPLREAIDGIVAGTRRRSTVSQLGGKLSVMMSQIHGLTAAASVDSENFGRTDVAAGIMNVYGKMLLNPSSLGETLDLVDAKSPYMKQSGMDADRDISEAARSMHGDDANVMQFAQKGFKLMHDLTMKPLWLQAYKKGLQLNAGNEESAVTYADKIIKGSTTGGRASDLPALMRGSETGKLITMFHGFVNAQTQLMYKAYGRVHQASDIPAFVGTYMNVMVIPGAMYALFHYGLPDDRKSQKMWQKAMIRSASPLSMVPIVSTLQDWAIDRGLGIPGHASMSPAGGGIDALYDLLQQSTSRSAHRQKVAESATKLASYTGLPIPGPLFMKAFPDQYSTWLWNTVDVIHNGMTPRASDLMKRRPARERSQ